MSEQPYQTCIERLEAYFRARPNRWIDGRELSAEGSFYAWRTRLSDIRRKRGMTIQNKLTWHRDAHGKPFTRSLYRFLDGSGVEPHEPEPILEGPFDANAWWLR